MRLKKLTRRVDAIAGNIKLFAWAGSWIRIVWTKISKATLEMRRASNAIHHREGICCFAFHWIWGLNFEWFSFCQKFLLIKLTLHIQVPICFIMRRLRQHNYSWITATSGQETTWVLSKFSNSQHSGMNSAFFFRVFQSISMTWLFTVYLRLRICWQEGQSSKLTQMVKVWMR